MGKGLSAEKRERIIAAAIEVLNQKELSQCLMDDIAEKARVAKGTIYLYYKSKDELYLEVLLSFMGNLKKIIEEVANQNAGAKIKLGRLIEKIADFLHQYRRVFFALQMEASSINISNRAHRSVHRRFSQAILLLARTLEPLMRQGIKEKVLKNYSPRTLAAFFLALLPVLVRMVIGSPELKNLGLEITPQLLYKFLLEGIGQ